MRKRNFLLVSAALATLSLSAQDFILPSAGGTGEKLLPDGVTANITQGKKYALNKNLTVAGSDAAGYKAFFAADNGVNGEELWVTDGTAAGTKMVKDIYPGATGSNITWLTRFNDKVVFAATDSEDYGNELWISDGTEEGTYMVADIHGFDSSNPQGFCQLDETRFVFFATTYDSENTGDGQQWLWISDGQKDEDCENDEIGTYLLAAVDAKYPGTSYDNLYDEIMRVGRKVYFKADVSDKDGVTYGEEPWVTDGTADGTFMVCDVNKEINSNKTDGSTNGAAVTFFRPAEDGRMVFKAWSEQTGNEMWITDGTEAGTYCISDVRPEINDNGIGKGSDPTMVGRALNGLVPYRGITDQFGNELAVVDYVNNTHEVYDINTSNGADASTAGLNSYPDTGQWFDGKYIFCAQWNGIVKDFADSKGGELIVYDPVAKGVSLQYDYAPGATGCNWVKEPIVVGGSYYWWNEGTLGIDNSKTKLHRLDTATGTPCIVSNISADGDGIHSLRNLNGTLLFGSTTTNNLYSYTYRSEVADLEKNPDVIVMGLDFGGEDSAIEDIMVDAKTVAVEYYNIQGQQLNAEPENGIFIKKAIKANGTVEATKVVK